MTERREGFTEFAERLVRIEERGNAACDIIEKIEKRLFGNGQEGELPLLRNDLSQTKKRVGSLENWKWYVVGTVTALVTLVTVMHHFGMIQ